MFEFLGIQAAKGTNNRWINPANTAQLVSVASGMASGTVANLTDRVASGQNVHTTDASGSWIGWQFSKLFRCTGFVVQLRSFSENAPRSLSLRQNTGTALTSATNPATWAVAGSWTNQIQLNAPNLYSGLFAATNPLTGNQLVIRLEGPDANGSNYLCFQEVFLFGDYFS